MYNYNFRPENRGVNYLEYVKNNNILIGIYMISLRVVLQVQIVRSLIMLFYKFATLQVFRTDSSGSLISFYCYLQTL